MALVALRTTAHSRHGKPPFRPRSELRHQGRLAGLSSLAGFAAPSTAQARAITHARTHTHTRMRREASRNREQGHGYANNARSSKHVFAHRHAWSTRPTAAFTTFGISPVTSSPTPATSDALALAGWENSARPAGSNGDGGCVPCREKEPADCRVGMES